MLEPAPRCPCCGRAAAVYTKAEPALRRGELLRGAVTQQQPRQSGHRQPGTALGWYRGVITTLFRYLILLIPSLLYIITTLCPLTPAAGLTGPGLTGRGRESWHGCVRRGVASVACAWQQQHADQ